MTRTYHPERGRPISSTLRGTRVGPRNRAISTPFRKFIPGPQFAVIILLLLAAGGLLFSCASPPEQSLAITHVTVIDMTGSPPLSDQTVLVQKQRIAAVGPAASIEISRHAQVLDARGAFLVPGLVDMHVHLTAAGEPDGSRRFMLPLLLANGITGVRDMGSYLESLIPLRKEIEEGKRLGPRIITPGPYLDGSPPSFEPSLVVTNRVQANEDVHQLVLRGADFVKVQSMLSRDAYFAIAQAAQREHIVFVGHVPDRVTAEEAAGAGQHSIEHLTNVLRGCSRAEVKLMRDELYVPPKQESPSQSHARIARWQGELLSSYSPEIASALIAKFKEKDVWQTPTLILLKENAFPTREDASASDDRSRYIPTRTLDLWKKARSAEMRHISVRDSRLNRELFQKSMNLVAEMQKAGVGILAGTDSPAPFVFPGSSLHDELQLFVEAGFTPLQALQSATKNPAEFLRATKDLGTIEKGKFADLLLVDANPLDDVRNSLKIRAVVLRGKLLNRDMLDALLEGVRDFAAKNTSPD